MRRAVAYVNLAAIERNVARLTGDLSDGASLCAVVKANGYGHGALGVAEAALAGGARSLAVAEAGEAVQLRAAGGMLKEAPLLVMGALTAAERQQALDVGAEVVVWREEEVDAVVAAGGGRVHIKLDTGMGRLGVRDPDAATRVLEAALDAPNVTVAGVMTHFATADQRQDDGFFECQLQRFAEWAGAMKMKAPGIIAHAANSAATLRSREAHFDMVRCGIAIYGLDPFGVDPTPLRLEPAFELHSYVADVKRCARGESVGYGRRFRATHDTSIGLLPIGYGDGWRRGLSGRCEVLVAGKRWPVVGTISMDQLTIDLGGGQQAAADAPRPAADAPRPAADAPCPGAADTPCPGAADTPCPGAADAPCAGAADAPCAAALKGRDAVLIGVDGDERITAEEVARLLGTINYEVTCGLSARVPRVFLRDGKPQATAAPARLGVR